MIIDVNKKINSLAGRMGKSIFFNTDVFRCVYLLLTMIEVSNMLDPGGDFGFIRETPITIIVLLWGGSLLIRDLIGRRSLLEMRNVWLLIAVLGLFNITILLNLYGWGDSIVMYIHLSVYFLVFCPPDKTASVKSKYKAIFLFFTVLIIPVTLMTVTALVSFFANISIEAVRINNYRELSRFIIIDFQHGRLLMFDQNLNLSATLTFLSIASLIICCTLFKFIFYKPYLIFIGKVISIILVIPHFTMLILTDARGSHYSLMLFALLFTFLALFRHITVKLKSILISCTIAALAAVIIAASVFLLEDPVRMGITELRALLTQVSAPQTQNNDENTPVFSEEVFGRDYYFDDTGRFDTWRIGFGIIKEHPVFGVSYGGRTRDLIHEAFDNDPIYSERTYLRPSHMISGYIQFALTNGIPALILVLIFFVLYAKQYSVILFKSLRSEHFLPAGAILSLSAVILFWNMFQTGLFYDWTSTTSIIFWSGLSFGATLLQYPETSEEITA